MNVFIDMCALAMAISWSEIQKEESASWQTRKSDGVCTLLGCGWLAKKKKYCQFFTRFGKCNKDNGKCPYIHDPSKIAVIPERMQDCSYFLQGLCSNESCPYRHVNVNPNSSVCEGFLRGYCSDGNEWRKKHTYVCLDFEATGNCPQGSKCKQASPSKKQKEGNKTGGSISL
nr:Zinc finger CCCH domain-containing protein 7 [Ipomoea batatas]